MGHTPYGYRIENGAAVINEAEAECVRRIFNNYISGMSLREAAKAAGHPLVHSTVKRMLTKKYYCGDDFYPAKYITRSPLSTVRRVRKMLGGQNCFLCR